MKRFFVLVMAVMMAVLCAGCGAAATQETTEVALPNPMEEVTAQVLMDRLGFEFKVPQGAENVKYFIIDKEMAEMQFTFNGVNCIARIKPTAEYEDISGMYYEWTSKEKGKVGYCDADIMRYQGKDITVDACLWFDAAPGVMYSVTGDGQDLDGFDIQAIAEQTYVPTQGDAG